MCSYVILLAVVIIPSFLFFYEILESLYWWILAFFIAGESSSSFFFLTQIVCLCLHSDIRPCASSLAFLSSGPFIWILLLSISRIVPTILPGGQPRCLFRRWDFFCKAWFRKVFFALVWHSFLIFSFISAFLWYHYYCGCSGGGGGGGGDFCLNEKYHPVAERT